MRLISLHVRSYRRLLDTKVNLAGKVIAVIGPNEAGKTSLLHALARLNDGGEVPPLDISRGSRPIDREAVYLDAAYSLDEVDQSIFNDLDLVALPVRMVYQRRIRGGSPMIGFEPSPVRRRTDYESAISQLNEFIASGSAASFDELMRHDDDEVVEEPTPSQRFLNIVAVLEDLATNVNDEHDRESEEIATDLERVSLGEVAAMLRRAIRWRRLPDVDQEARNRIHARMPRYLLFSDDDRNLLNEYDIQGGVAENPPPALANLARLADLDLVQLRVAIEEGDYGRTVTIQNRANKQLATMFARTWRQSNITVELNLQGTIVRVLIKENDDIVTTFDERSAGLRMFVALAAFIATRENVTPPVLLIDEAETHLHYDAQADLVNMLLTQQEAIQVIYTTHSPGCLPPDLGTGIRVVAPSAVDPAISVVHNAFWTGRVAGFSPLLLAMGAGAAAFAVTRYAVLAEGPSEMILMPSLIRAAMGLDVLPYQIAPGLSEAATSQYPDLDLQAARVAFTVDGDQGGARLRERLIAGGVPGDRIAVLTGMTLEDAVDLDSYRTAVKAEADAANGSMTEEMPSAEFSAPRASAVERWYKQLGLIPPSKIAVANRLVQEGKAIPSEEGQACLRALHEELISILGI